MTLLCLDSLKRMGNVGTFMWRYLVMTPFWKLSRFLFREEHRMSSTPARPYQLDLLHFHIHIHKGHMRIDQSLFSAEGFL